MIGRKILSWVRLCMVVAEVLLLLSYDFVGVVGTERSGCSLHLDSIFERGLLFQQPSPMFSPLLLCQATTHLEAAREKADEQRNIKVRHIKHHITNITI